MELATARVGRRRGHDAGVRLRAGAPRLQPARRDAGFRLAGRSARGSGRALGRRLVPGDRPLRLPARRWARRPPRARPSSRSIRSACGRSRGSASPPVAGRRAAVGVRAGAGAVRHPPADDARARRRRRPVAGGRDRAPGGAPDGVRADGVLLLRRLLGVAVSGAVGRAVLVRAPGTLGARRSPRRACGGDAEHGHRAAAAGADALSVRPARGPRGGRERAGADALARLRPRYRVRLGRAVACLCRRLGSPYMAYLGIAGGDGAGSVSRTGTSGEGTSRAHTSGSGTGSGGLRRAARSCFRARRAHSYFPQASGARRWRPTTT